MLENGNNSMVMPVSPMYGNGNGGFGFGGDWGWIILLLLCANGGFGLGGGFGGYGNMMLGYDFPWLLNGQNGINNNVSDGFRSAQLNDGITSIRDGIGNLQTQLCNSFAQAEIAENSRQMADMQQMFGLSQQLSQCCCDNRLATANLSSDIAREACATRTNDTQNTQAILNTINGGIQSIKDQLCQDKIDAKNDEIAQLRQEVLFARGKDSQDLQTAQITNDVYNRLATCPVNTIPVYGNQPVYSCMGNNYGCGCGA